MEFGAHLPLIGAPRTLAELTAYARRAAALDYRVLCANDHLYFARPWLDGPTALAATLEASGEMAIATTVALPVIRGVAQTAKLLTALDVLSGGRLIAAVGPGSSARDYAAAGVPFGERWARFDQVVRELRVLLREVEPRRPDGPPLWLASWGSPAGMRRVVRLGDGWLASGYNTAPEAFAQGVAASGGLPNAIATIWMYVTERRRDRDRILADVLSPMLKRPPEALTGLLVGSAAHCAELLSAYAAAGAQRVFVWPLEDELAQLEALREDVIPRVG